MKKKYIILFIFCILFFKCSDNKSVRKKYIEEFIRNSRDSFIKSDLLKYRYNPRSGFEKIWAEGMCYRVSIYRDSSLLVLYDSTFIREFKMNINGISQNEVIISKVGDDKLLFSSSIDGISITQKNNYKSGNLNVVDYFLKLKKQIDSYHLIQIRENYVFQSYELIFTRYDYLLYIPPNIKRDYSVVKELNKYLENGDRIDSNWYYFKSDNNIDF